MTTNHYQVTENQLDACSRIVDLNQQQVFYLVQSATTPGVEYKVIFDRKHRVITCDCKAGQEGSGCWHKRAALKAAENFKTDVQARIAQQEHILREIESDEREMCLETSSSLDGLYYEVCPASGRMVPMR